MRIGSGEGTAAELATLVTGACVLQLANSYPTLPEKRPATPGSTATPSTVTLPWRTTRGVLVVRPQRDHRFGAAQPEPHAHVRRVHAGPGESMPPKKSPTGENVPSACDVELDACSSAGVVPRKAADPPGLQPAGRTPQSGRQDLLGPAGRSSSACRTTPWPAVMRFSWPGRMSCSEQPRLRGAAAPPASSHVTVWRPCGDGGPMPKDRPGSTGTGRP